MLGALWRLARDSCLWRRLPTGPGLPPHQSVWSRFLRAVLDRALRLARGEPVEDDDEPDEPEAPTATVSDVLVEITGLNRDMTAALKALAERVAALEDAARPAGDAVLKAEG